MIDVHDFKKFNDQHGHQCGDEVLRAIGMMIAGEVRRDLDVACRYGGEEFTVILPNTPQSAEQVAERLRRRVAAASFAAADGAALGVVTVSIGVATFPSAGADVNALVSAADEALYLAKSGGKNRVEMAAKGE